MFRKTLTASLVVVAMLLSVLALGGFTESAEAQGAPTCPVSYDYYAGYVAAGCADSATYPGPFTNHPDSPTGPYGWGKLNVVAGAGADVAPDAGGDAGTGGGLAHTGSESTVLGYVGTGLIAFGAVALGSRRKFFQGALED